MSINDRLKAICENKKIKNIDLVKLGCGSQQTVSFVLNGKVKPNTEFIEIFLRAYPDVNARWLLTGEGDETNLEEPRTQYGFCKECIKKEGVIEHLKKECQAKDKRILELEIKIAGAEGRVKSQAG
jgi:hypothetical protein